MRERGFTLPELAVVGVLLFLLAGVMMFLLHPVDYAAERRDAKRRTDVARIMQAVNAYTADHRALPPHITAEKTAIASGESDSGLCADLVPAYISDMPLDPNPDFGLKLAAEKRCNDLEQVYTSGYTVQLTETGQVTIAAPATELSEPISLTR